jgi:hypothetical protein
MCGQKQKNMWSKLKKNTAKKTVQIEVSYNLLSLIFVMMIRMTMRVEV